MPFRLVSAEEGSLEQVRTPSFDLRDGATLVIGRALTSDVPIFDPTISRRHAQLTCNSLTGHVDVKDLGSSNGTFVNGQRVEASRVAPGDIVAFGKVRFRVMPISSHREKHEQKLALLLEISKGLTRISSVDALLDKIAGFCLQIFSVDYVSVLLKDEQGEYVPKVARHRGGQGEQQTAEARTVPKSIVRRVVQDRVAILSDNAPEDVRFGGESIVMQRVRSAMCAPLEGSDGEILGVLYVDNVTTQYRVTEEDLEFLSAFAGIAAAAIENGQFADHIRRQVVVRSNFERYFAPSLAERIANAPESVKLGGDKRSVAVLFSDIRAFSALSESMNPDEIATLLSEYFTEMVECVFRHGGTLDKFIGDAVMAQWGAPITTPEDADHAVQAALDMMRAIESLNAQRRLRHQPELGVGVGINYGEVFAGNIGSERRLEFTVIGDTVNTANRLSSVAGAGEILITESVRRALHLTPQLEECLPLELKGKANSVPIYRVMGL